VYNPVWNLVSVRSRVTAPVGSSSEYLPCVTWDACAVRQFVFLRGFEEFLIG
jgi:hypothetical protein